MDTTGRHGGETEYRRQKRERDQYVQKVQRLEAYARAHPAAYRRKLMLLAWLGYGAIGLLLLLGLGLLGGVVYMVASGRLNAAAFKLVIVVVIFIAVILRSLFIRWPKPEGFRLKREDAPGLFDMVDDLAVKLRAPKIHEIIITDDFNAFAAQWPRLGLFGWYRNILALGLPYMLAVDVEELKATVAHELGHFSGSHGRTGNKIYRLNLVWYSILQHSSNGILRWFMTWYQPLFNAYSFAFRRQNEYEADAAAVAVGSARANATDLMRFSVQARVAHEYWADVYTKVNDQPSPPGGVFEGMASRLKEPVERAKVDEWLEKAFAEKTGYDDTHPALTDRLTAMNTMSLREGEQWNEVAESIRTAPSPSAAETLLGPKLPWLFEHLDSEWRDTVHVKWLERHRYARDQLQEMASLDAKEEGGSATEEDLLRKAEILTELYGMERAEPVLRKVLAISPRNAEANFQIGAHLLETDEAAGEAMLKVAAESDPAYRPSVYSILFSIHEEQGSEHAEQLYEQAVAEERLLEEANRRLLHMQKSDVLVPHKLPPAEVKRLEEYFADKQKVKAVYAVQKPAANLPDRELNLLIIEQVTKWSDVDSDDRLKKVLAEISDLDAGKDTGWMVLTSQKWLAKRLEEMQGALIFKR